MVELFREDTGEILFLKVITGPGVIRIPGRGGQGFHVKARITWPDGTVETE